MSAPILSAVWRSALVVAWIATAYAVYAWVNLDTVADVLAAWAARGP